MAGAKLIFVTVLASTLLCCCANNANSSSQSGKWQALLVALQRNPALAQQLRSNPTLIRNLKAELNKLKQQKLQQQQQQQQQQLHLRRDSFRPRSSLPLQQQDQCAALRKQNARLKQMVSAVLEDHELATSSSSLSSSKRRTADFLSDSLALGHGSRGSLGRPQRELNKAQLLLNRVAQENKGPKVSVESVLVTPSATWSTVVESSSYLTTVTESLTTELPIILRGSKVVTTIIEPTILTVTATELKTSSSLVTPTPTWSTTTVTVSASVGADSSAGASASASLPSLIPQQQAPIVETRPLFPSLWPKVQTPPRRLVDPSGLEHADVLEIGRGTSASVAREKLERLKQAYGIFFANTKQQQQQFGLRQQAANPNPIFAGTDNDDDDYDYLDGYDQQVLAAQARPVFVEASPQQQQSDRRTARAPAVAPILAQTAIVAAVPEPEVEVKTIYISGRVPGEYTTSLTTITKTPSSSPAGASAINDSPRTPRRARREAPAPEIRPTRVVPILRTDPPSEEETDSAPPTRRDNNLYDLLSSLLSLQDEVDELSRMPLFEPSIKTVTVTVTTCHTP